MYNSPNRQTSLPPGHYKFSNKFPSMIQQLSPKYFITTEPVFLDYLLMNVGKSIRVVTTNGSLDGKLSGVAIDHLQLTVNGLNYHIRFQHIIYFIGKP